MFLGSVDKASGIAVAEGVTSVGLICAAVEVLGSFSGELIGESFGEPVEQAYKEFQEHIKGSKIDNFAHLIDNIRTYLDDFPYKSLCVPKATK